MQTNKTFTQPCTTSKALQEYLPLELLHSSIPLNWPGVIVRYYASQDFSGNIAVPATPDHLIILNLSQTRSGIIRRQSGFQPMAVKSHPGNISCLAANQSSLISIKEQTHYLYLHILSELWNKLAGQVLGVPGRSVQMQSVYMCEDDFLEDILLKILTELKYGGKGSRLYVESLSQALVVHLFRHYLTCKQEADTTESLPGYKLKKALTYIEENLYEKITLHQLSAQVGFSAFHFARLFKATTGLAPYQYIRKMRMEYSQRLLLETDLSIIQIGFEVGIGNPSHFSSFFKQCSGVTPTVYRKSAG